MAKNTTNAGAPNGFQTAPGVPQNRVVGSATYGSPSFQAPPGFNPATNPSAMPAPQTAIGPNQSSLGQLIAAMLARRGMNQGQGFNQNPGFDPSRIQSSQPINQNPGFVQPNTGGQSGVGPTANFLQMLYGGNRFNQPRRYFANQAPPQQ